MPALDQQPPLSQPRALSLRPARPRFPSRGRSSRHPLLAFPSPLSALSPPVLPTQLLPLKSTLPCSPPRPPPRRALGSVFLKALPGVTFTPHPIPSSVIHSSKTSSPQRFSTLPRRTFFQKQLHGAVTDPRKTGLAGLGTPAPRDTMVTGEATGRGPRSVLPRLSRLSCSRSACVRPHQTGGHAPARGSPRGSAPG